MTMFGGTSGWCRRRAVPAATILALITTAGLVVSTGSVHVWDPAAGVMDLGRDAEVVGGL
jgi:hypothetical protein